MGARVQEKLLTQRWKSDPDQQTQDECMEMVGSGENYNKLAYSSFELEMTNVVSFRFLYLICYCLLLTY